MPSGLSLAEVADLRQAALVAFRAFYRDHEVPEIRPPLLVGVTGACENIDTLLAVTNEGAAGSPEPFASYLSQTGQLALETALTQLRACWCQTVSFRDDRPDSRHLREFELIEEEFAAPTGGTAASDLDEAVSLLTALLDRVEEVLRAGIRGVLDTCAGGALGLDTGHLRAALCQPFPRMTYDEALTLANAARRQRRQRHLDWGDDLQPEDERAILDASRTNGQLLPTVVTLFPAELKFFNMKLDHRDRRRVLSADVLLPYSGEAVGAAVREDDYEALVHRLTESPMFHALTSRNIASLADFDRYLRLIRDNETPLHAGYGLGLDRLLQFMVRGADIRASSIASLLEEAS